MNGKPSSRETIDLTLDDAEEEGAAIEACPICGVHLPVAELPGHCDAHFAAPEAGVSNFAPSTSTSATDDAALAWQLSLLQEGGDEARAVQRLAEQQEFEELRARYGFSDAPPRERKGRCFVCTQPGHWASECPSRPQVAPITAAADAVAAAQALGAPSEAGRQAIDLLAGCLAAQTAPSEAYLCGPLAHFCGDESDSGWGCGYRNIMMMASHLLQTSPEARRVLFAGAAFVPGVPYLQAWLEVAWAEGFDMEGAESLGNRVQGTRKWIGTTEAAVVFSYFGVRTVIIDFEDKSQRDAGPSGRGTAPGTSGAAPTGFAVHPRVQCDGCGMLPIMGARYCSSAVPDYDLCARCYEGAKDGPAAPFARVQAGSARCSDAAAAPGADSGHKHAALMRWVWRYFSGEAGCVSSAAACDSSGAGGAGVAACGRGSAQSGGAATCSHGGGGGGAATCSHGGGGGGSGRAARVHRTGLCPLYFQHEGHSRTIVGIERRPAGRAGEGQYEYLLLVLDPGCPGDKLMGALQAGRGWQRLVKRGAHTLRRPQYQLMYALGGRLATPAEREALKTVRAAEFHQA